MDRRSIALDNCILRGVVGSSVHGLSVAAQDDRDEMGVCIEPPEYVLGLESFEHYVYRDQPEGKRSGPGDLDLTIYSLRKYCRLAANGNPTALLLLWVPDEALVMQTDLGRGLRELAPAFVSQRAIRAFRGYMSEQRRRLAGEQGQMAVNRPELIEAYGFDTKYAGHVLRLGHQGLEFAATGRLTLPMADPIRQHIVDVRRGKVTLEEVIQEATDLTRQLDAALDKSNYPEEADREAISRFMVAAYRQWWQVGMTQTATKPPITM